MREASIGRGGQGSLETGISDNDLVPMTFEKTPLGDFRTRPAKPLVNRKPILSAHNARSAAGTPASGNEVRTGKMSSLCGLG